MALDISIRTAAAADAGEVAALWTEAYVLTPGGGRDKPYSEQDFTDSQTAGEVFIAERGEQMAGVIVLLPGDSEWARASTAEEAEISRLAVRSSARRSGVARALMSFCQERAEARGYSAIALWTRPAQGAAHRLYESLGYCRAPERDTTDRYGPRLVYRLKLGGRSTEAGSLESP